MVRSGPARKLRGRQALEARVRSSGIVVGPTNQDHPTIPQDTIQRSTVCTDSGSHVDASIQNEREGKGRMNQRGSRSVVPFQTHSKRAATVALLTICAGLACPLQVGASSRSEPPCLVREERQDESRECPCPKNWTPTTQQVADFLKTHESWLVVSRHSNDFARPGRAIFCNAKFSQVNFENALLNSANFEGSDLFTNATTTINRGTHYEITGVNFKGARLRRANLKDAVLRLTNFEGADLTNADLRGADLFSANLTKAKIVGTDLSGARIAYTALRNAEFAPVSLPSGDQLEGITGLHTVTFPKDRPGGLVRFRELARKSGLRTLEREATFAIESNTSRNLMDACPPRRWFNRPSRFQAACAPGAWFEGVGRFMLFGWTTGWGLYPFRALQMMVSLILLMTPIYAVFMSRWFLYPSASSGIFRIWPRDHLERRQFGVRIVEGIRSERISTGFAGAVAWGLYFSMLSAFNIGWRDISVGDWITRLQYGGYVLRSYGWVRVAAGIQALLSVYLLALWVLTYFGRPF